MVREHIDTIDSLMARYVAGSLPTPARVLVESHLELKDDYRGYVRDLETLAGEELAALRPADLERDRMLGEIYRSEAVSAGRSSDSRVRPSSIFPNVLRDFVGFDADEVPWRTKLPGFREYEVGDIEGCHVSLFWIKPGRGLPAHTHKGCELSLVLDGAFSDVFGRYERGDISVADDTVEHRPVAGKERPCIGFAVVDAPLKLTGSWPHLIRDLIG